MLEYLWEKFTNWIIRFVGFDNYRFDEINIKEGLIYDIIQAAKNNYPNEFVALLGGYIKNKKLIIDSLIYQESYNSRRSVLMRMNLPLLHGTFGSVHSHPSYSNRPSDADLRFFNKRGFVHLIICQPYNFENIEAYSNNGERLNFKII